MALAVQHYFAQLAGPAPQSKMGFIKKIGQILRGKKVLVHSDVSPGNLRITTDGNVAILDRGMYLQFSLEERKFLKSLLDAADNQTIAAAFVDWLWSMKENKNVVAGLDKQIIIADIAKELNLDQADPEKSWMKLLVAVHKHQLTVPLKFTLLSKNLLVLRNFVKLADPTWTLRDALSYAPSHDGSSALALMPGGSLQ